MSELKWTLMYVKNFLIQSLRNGENMIRQSICEIIQEIYVDVNYNGDSHIIQKEIYSDKVTIYKTLCRDGFEGIFNKLQQIIHPRYTRVIIDGGLYAKPIFYWIDEKFNFYLKQLGDMRVKTVITMIELVEVRKATEEDIKKWGKYL